MNFKYDPIKENDLQLDKNEEIVVLDTKDSDRWYGRGKYGVGWFPSNFVEVISPHFHCNEDLHTSNLLQQSTYHHQNG